MKVIMFSSECNPFAKVGGLADVVGALPKALKKLHMDVEIFMPFYKKTQSGKFEFKRHPVVPEIKIEGTFAGVYPLYQSFLPSTDIPVTFISHPDFFEREGIYDDPKTGEGYKDQALRWIFFSKAGYFYLKNLKQRPHIVHCHDNHTGLLPAYIKYHNFPVKTVFHIHNIAYQGNYDMAYFPYIELPSQWTRPGEGLEFWGNLSFLKSGIVFSDKVVTVSPTYAKEVVENPEFGMGMEGILRAKGEDFSGIINGIDVDEWNPETDPLLPYHYSKDNLENKKLVKDALLSTFKLPKLENGFCLLGMVSRLADQKGLDILSQAFEEMMKLNVQVVILGTGQLIYHEILSSFAKKYPNLFGLKLGFDNAVAHLIEGGADIFLMPSHFEPCGLNQMYSLRYGTIPLVRKTGGLADTVEKVSEDGQRGVGFVFEGKEPKNFLEELKRALNFYKDRELWKKIQIRGMEMDFSWEASAKKFIDLYKNII
ncbi:MAG: glycogen synthase GlgA [Thermoanaerobaculia bacterium]